MRAPIPRYARGAMRTAIDDETRAALAPYGFDELLFARFAERARRSDPDDNAVRGVVTLPAPEDVTDLPARGSAAHERLRARGLAAMREGRVGVVILAGGMATRFGGVVKAVVPVLEGKTFLDLKVEDVVRCAQHAGGEVPIYVMTSFATHARIVEATAALGAKIEAFPQFVSLRLTPEGELFRGADGRPSPYATGHGDLTFALRRSGLLATFRARGGRLLFVSNVDNLGATLEPAVVGFHLERGAKITAEVVDKEPGDKGGAPARVDSVPQIVEAFRFPRGFDQDAIAVFNTNTLVLDAEAIDRELELPFYRVQKSVDGRAAIQFERLVGELTALLPTAFLRVPRDGEDGRFQPAKDPDELARRLPNIEVIVRSDRFRR